jgi:hypothetical protein
MRSATCARTVSGREIREGHLSDHKFQVGQLVRYTSYGASGVYKITQLLPPVGDEPQYRIKSEDEPHERVVKESVLTGVA